jgi:hypothetical protein
LAEPGEATLSFSTEQDDQMCLQWIYKRNNEVEIEKVF